MDREMKLVAAQACTDASVHDSQILEAVLRGPEEGGEGVWADGAYRSEAQERRLAEGGHCSQIHERAYRDAPLDDEQRAHNQAKHAGACARGACFRADGEWHGWDVFAQRGPCARQGGCGVDESGLQSSACRVADPQQGVSIHPGDGTGSWGSVKRCGKREWRARFRQEEGREQGVNRSGFSPQNIATRAKPRLIRPAASPHPQHRIYRSALKLEAPKLQERTRCKIESR